MHYYNEGIINYKYYGKQNYVEDCCRGFVELAESKKTIGETINIGSNTEISIGDTFNLIKELMSSDVTLVNDEQRKRPKKSEVFRLCCDNKKIKKLINYEPKIDIRNGLKKTMFVKVDVNKRKTIGYRQKTLEKFGRIFAPENIGNYSRKISKICNTIKKSKGIIKQLQGNHNDNAN